MEPERRDLQLVRKSQQQMVKLLDWAYSGAVNGLPGQTDVYTLVEKYLRETGNDQEKALAKLIAMQTTKAATSGFLTGVGGLATLPVTLPANKAAVILFQMRMIAAIALLRGYDLKNQQVRPFVYACLTGKSMSDLFKNTGIATSSKVARNVIRKIPAKSLQKINQRLGFRLVTKFTGGSLIKLSRIVPVLGGVVGAGFDTTTTLIIAKATKQTFSVSAL